jgi:hypothetical protein
MTVRSGRSSRQPASDGAVAIVGCEKNDRIVAPTTMVGHPRCGLGAAGE